MTKNNIKWLTTLDLENFITKFADPKTKTAFLGVFPIDCLPRKMPNLPLLFIINTNASNLSGQHWKAIYVSKDKIGEVFDSLAVPVSLFLQQWLNTFTKRWSISTLTLQNPLAPTCGGYVLYFIMTRLKHNSLSSCLSKFTNNVLKNDEFVEQFFNAVSQ